MKHIIVAFMLAFMLGGCVTPPVDPNAPPLTQEEQLVLNMQKAIDYSRFALIGFDAYIVLKSNDWPEDKLRDFNLYADDIRAAIDATQDYLDAGNFTAVALSQVAAEELIAGFRRHQVVELDEAATKQNE